MALTRANIITEIKRFYNRGDIADDQIITYMDFAIQTALEEREWQQLKELSTVATTADQETVTNGITDATRALYRVTLNKSSPVSRKRLVYLPPDEYLALYGGTTGDTGEPGHYTIMGRTLYLGQTPDAVYSLRIHRSLFPSLYVDGSNSTTVPILRLERYIIHYATAWMYDIKEMDDLAQKHFQRAQSHLTSAMRIDGMLNAELRTSAIEGYNMVDTYVAADNYRLS